MFVWTTIALIAPAFAWWDEGHMLVAQIAKNSLAAGDAEILEDVLALWNGEFPGMSSLPVAATWPDHIKCRNDRPPACEGIGHVAALELFNPWHYTSVPYNPQGIQLPPQAAAFQHIPGANCTLSQIYTSLTGRYLHSGGCFARPLSPRRGASTGSSNSGVPRGTATTWNFQLRLLIHIFGDIHQPLHSVETYSKCFPDGDSGGNKVVVRGHEGHETLHAYWDSCALDFNRSWPTVSESEIQVVAKEIEAAFPRPHADALWPKNEEVSIFDAVVAESHDVARRYVYDAIFAPNGNSTLGVVATDMRHHHLEFFPSATYKHRSSFICRRQIATAGYRLGQLLSELVPYAAQFLMNVTK